MTELNNFMSSHNLDTPAFRSFSPAPSEPALPKPSPSTLITTSNQLLFRASPSLLPPFNLPSQPPFP